MVDERSVLRWVSWRDCCPWLLLFRSFLISISVRALLLATLGTMVVWFGWWLLGLLPFGEVVENAGHAVCPIMAAGDARSDLSQTAQVPEQWDVGADAQPLLAILPQKPVYMVWREISRPFVQVFNPRLRPGELTYYFLGGVWTLAVWALVGGALSRIGIVQLGREERVGLVDSVNYAQKFFLSYLGGPLFPLVGIFLLAIPVAILGLIMRLPVGNVLGGVLWGLVIVDGLVMALLALGITLGWPLMWGTISAEGSDAFDSLSRCFAYTFQRALHYAFYILVTVLFGWLCWFVVSFFADLVVHLAFWATAWGSGGHVDLESVHVLREEQRLTTEISGTFWLSLQLVAFWEGCVRTVAVSWSYAFFFISMAGVYLLIRRDVDQTETDEIYIEDDDETYGMPPLTTDESGVPKATDMPEKQTDEQAQAPADAAESIGDEPQQDNQDESGGSGEKPES